MHLDNGFSNERRSEESPERHQEVAAGDSSQVKQGVRDLKRTHTQEAVYQRALAKECNIQ